ncbi:MAG: AbiV family abortive infection protein [Deltaproteobacteria bacterium]|nr:AbiV family abortive infection protein [Deltaproteobacteria bacterium]
MSTVAKGRAAGAIEVQGSRSQLCYTPIMKQNADRSMPVAVIAKGVVEVHANAVDLIEEAGVLSARERWARAFALAHFAREELAKIPLLLIAGVRATSGAPVAWPIVRKFLNDHKPKWQIAVSDLVREREYLHEADQARLREELSVVAYLGKLVLAETFKDNVFVEQLWHDNVNRWGRRREQSLYVEEVNGTFKKPRDRIPPGTALNAVSRSRMTVRYYEPLIPEVAAFLANAPTTAPLSSVMTFRMRLSGGGVGGTVNNSLLD